VALARVKVWIPGDVLTAADLNAEFNNLINNPVSLISPTTGPINFALQAHTNLLPAVVTGTSGSTGDLLTVSTAGTAIWAAPSSVLSTAPRILQVKGDTSTGTGITSTTPTTVAGQPITPASTNSRIKLLYSADVIQLSAPGIAQSINLHLVTSSGTLLNSDRVFNQINIADEGIRATVAWTYLVPASAGPFPTNYDIQAFAFSSTSGGTFGEVKNVEMILEELSS
jgi:hypothetical protein